MMPQIDSQEANVKILGGEGKGGVDARIKCGTMWERTGEHIENMGNKLGTSSGTPQSTIVSDKLGRVAAGNGQARPCGGACRDRNDDTLTGTRGGVTSVLGRS